VAGSISTEFQTKLHTLLNSQYCPPSEQQSWASGPHLDAKHLVADWQSKGHNAATIDAKLVTRFREKAPSYSSVTNWLRRLHFGEDVFEPGIRSGKPSDGIADFKILTEQTVFPFHSVRAHARALKILRSMIWDHPQKGPFLLTISGGSPTSPMTQSRGPV
jgi:hypothetical protein